MKYLLIFTVLLFGSRIFAVETGYFALKAQRERGEAFTRDQLCGYLARYAYSNHQLCVGKEQLADSVFDKKALDFCYDISYAVNMGPEWGSKVSGCLSRIEGKKFAVGHESCTDDAWNALNQGPSNGTGPTPAERMQEHLANCYQFLVVK